MKNTVTNIARRWPLRSVDLHLCLGYIAHPYSGCGVMKFRLSLGLCRELTV